MAILLFKLRHVPQDEADEVRELLDANDIAYYETSAGNWRISMPALWLRDESQLQRARQLLDVYQQERFRKAREEYAERRRNGEQQTLWQRFLQDPFRVAGYLSAALLILYLSLQAFLSLSAS